MKERLADDDVRNRADLRPFVVAVHAEQCRRPRFALQYRYLPDVQGAFIGYLP